MSKNTFARTITMSIATAGLAAAAYAGTAVGHADTVQQSELRLENTICSYLDQNPTLAGVDFVVTTQISTGIDYRDIARITTTAAYDVCPRHASLVRTWVNS